MNTKRYAMLDSLRGVTLISMILYHAAWDVVYIFGVEWAWYKSEMAYVWQQSICWCFILLSGFCWSFGRKKWKRGITVFVAGVIVSLVTLIAMPQDRVVFGVLTFLGTAMLIMIPLDKVLYKCRPIVGFIISFVLFVICRNINRGWLGFEDWNWLELPRSLYANLFSTYLGFKMTGFFSTDYFAVLPWFFLFCCGYYGEKAVKRKDLYKWLNYGKCVILEKIGRNSLLIYMIHQPVIYGVLWVIFTLKSRM